jgi:hypothetical protein
LLVFVLDFDVFTNLFIVTFAIFFDRAFYQRETPLAWGSVLKGRCKASYQLWPFRCIFFVLFVVVVNAPARSFQKGGGVGEKTTN